MNRVEIVAVAVQEGIEARGGEECGCTSYPFPLDRHGGPR